MPKTTKLMKTQKAEKTSSIRKVKIGRATLYCGDSLKVLPRIAKVQAEKGRLGFHACVSDPPYDLTAAKKGGSGEKSINLKHPAGRSRITTGGFMGAKWDATGIAFRADLWQRVMSVLCPGAHVLSFGGDRTYHRMACAIEDAGCDIRTQIAWIYGQGMPHGLNIGLAVDKKLRGCPQGTADKASPNHKRMLSRTKVRSASASGWSTDGKQVKARHADTEGWNPEALKFRGFNTALKPAMEPICVARTPMRMSATGNMLKFHTGSYNVEACCVDGVPEATRFDPSKHAHDGWRYDATGAECKERADKRVGRYPANVLHDGSPEVLDLFPRTTSGKAAKGGHKRNGDVHRTVYSKFTPKTDDAGVLYGDSGSAARFFYQAKASKKDRDYGMDGVAAKPFIQFQTANGTSSKASSLSEGRNTEYRNTHPTVKPVALMRWLVKLVTWPGGTVLDPFMGSGSTGIAAILEGNRFVGIEQDPAFFEIACRRITKAVEERAALESTLAKEGGWPDCEEGPSKEGCTRNEEADEEGH